MRTGSDVGSHGGRGTAVVLAGAGARGAYEAGALSVLLPALPPEERPQIYVGTSAGAINAAGFAAFSHLDAAEAGARVVDQWRQLRQIDVFRPVGRTTARNLAGLLRGKAPAAVLDSEPLWTFLHKQVSFDQLRYNLAFGHIQACAAVATDQWTHRNSVFTACGDFIELPPADDVRGIDYRRVTLAAEHVMASSAIPGVFPAIDIPPVEGAPPDWFIDGGIRLNTPIKPALKFGADRIIVVATSPERVPVQGDNTLPRPAATGGLVDLARAIMDDPLVEDLQVLRRDNYLAATDQTCNRRVIPHIFVGPPDSTVLGELARDVLKTRSWVPPHTIGRLTSKSADLCQLASHVLFDPDFIAGALELGQQHAREKLAKGGIVWETEAA